MSSGISGKTIDTDTSFASLVLRAITVSGTESMPFAATNVTDSCEAMMVMVDTARQTETRAKDDDEMSEYKPTCGSTTKHVLGTMNFAKQFGAVFSGHEIGAL